MDRPDPAPPFDAGPDFDDNPEWTDEDFAKARPASEVLPAHIVAQLVRADDDRKTTVTLELDGDVIAKFRAIGPDWQDRINEVLRAADLSDGVRSHAA